MSHCRLTTVGRCSSTPSRCPWAPSGPAGSHPASRTRMRSGGRSRGNGSPGAERDRVADDTVARGVISDSRCPQGHDEAKQTLTNPEDSRDRQQSAEHLHQVPDERAVLPRRRLKGVGLQRPCSTRKLPDPADERNECHDHPRENGRKQHDAILGAELLLLLVAAEFVAWPRNWRPPSNRSVAGPI